MKKRKNTKDFEVNPEERKRKLNFKRKKQRNREREIDYRRMSNLNDFDEYEQYD